MNIQDLERATSFHRDQLQLPFLFAAAGTMSFFDVGGTRLMLSLPSAPEFDHPGSILYLDVADIGRAHTELPGRGVRFEQAPHLVAPLAHADLRLAFFRDSEGNLLALSSEVARKG
jgi:methylmalonyl-CoA/ethylmalonyl-CoA epimerase